MNVSLLIFLALVAGVVFLVLAILLIDAWKWRVAEKNRHQEELAKIAQAGEAPPPYQPHPGGEIRPLPDDLFLPPLAADAQPQEAREFGYYPSPFPPPYRQR